jgi:glycosyltransferase involved in cell wall biosynthesis
VSILKRALEVALYWILSAIVRAASRLLPVRPAAGTRPNVHILLMNAWAIGGTIRSTLQLAGLLTATHDVEVVSVIRRRDEPLFEFPAGVRVTVLDDRRASAVARRGRAQRVLGAVGGRLLHPGDRARLGTTLWTDLQLLKRIWRIREGVLLGTRPGLNLLALDAARRGVKVVGAEHMHHSAHSRAMRAEIRRRYPALAALVVLTDHDLCEYRELIGRRTRVVRIPNTVPEPAEAPAGLTEPLVLAAGRLTPQKGFDLLIDAFAEISADHPEWRLRICGRGPYRAALERQAMEKGVADRVTLAGQSRNLEREMAQASVYALSSRFEGLPMVLLEAMRAGLAVVSFDCPTGPGEVIEHERDGILVPNGDVSAFAHAMGDLMRDEAKRHRLGAAARVTAAEYSPAAVGPQWESLLTTL